MGFVQELTDLLKPIFKCFEIVYEYQQGLYIRNGIVRELPKKRLGLDEEQKINSLEKELLKEMGYVRFLPFRRPELPDGFRQSKLSGLPLHNGRYSKILRPGLYFFFPPTGHIVTDSIQERVLNLGNIAVPTTDKDSKSMFVSCNLRYELQNLYLAYTEVHDYEVSLKDHTLSILAECSRGKAYAEWTQKEAIDDLEKEVLQALQLKAEEWGLKIHHIYITDNVPCQVQRLAHDGSAVTIQNKLAEEKS